MKHWVVLLMAVFLSALAKAQCTVGNCVNGTGTYNYGWCIYTGEFKNSMPEGTGTMKYDTYTYTGHFLKGLEDGDGVIVNKDGSKENVRYAAGKNIAAPLLVKVEAKDYKPLEGQYMECITGDCNDGFGTYQFKSGNKYTGNFKAHKREGSGTFYFADGDRFEGIFANDEKSSGTYFFSTGAKYTGTYDSKGIEYDGTITSVNGMAIPFVKGKAIIPPPPKIKQYDENYARSNSPAGKPEQVKTWCNACFGSGKNSRIEDWSGPTSTHLVRVYSSCSRCGGKGSY